VRTSTLPATAVLAVKAPQHEERDPVFLRAAEVNRLASSCARNLN
jgi:hypothetical protein